MTDATTCPSRTAFSRRLYLLELAQEREAAACDFEEAAREYRRLHRLGLATEGHYQRREALRDRRYELSVAYDAAMAGRTQ